MAEKPVKSVIVFGSTFSPMKPRSVGPGANTWISGPPGIWIPPAIGLGCVSTAVAVPDNDQVIAAAMPTTREIPNRPFIVPLPPKRPMAPLDEGASPQAASLSRGPHGEPQ